MALSLDAIYKPFNDFFIQKFASGGAHVKFRFARLPRALSDSDFTLPDGPTDGPSDTVAKEVTSFLVDRVMRLDDDAPTVSQGPSSIADVYDEELLGPSMPFVPVEIMDETERQALMDAYSAVKAAAVHDDQAWAESLLRGAGVKYHPATAEPEKWWDKSADVWTHQSFEVVGAVSTPSPRPPLDLLRMKMDDGALAAVLADLNKPKAPRWQDSNIKLNPDVLARIRDRKLHVPHPVPTELSVAGGALGAAKLKAGDGIKIGSLKWAGGHPVAPDPDPPPLHDWLFGTLHKEPVTTRFDIEAILADNAQREPVITNNATISFSYCIVSVDRSWFHEAFIRNPYWRVPGRAAGDLSANDGYGLPVLPVGFVAIKDLSIAAPWTAQDISNLEKSEGFGPFNFDSTVVGGAIGHAGIQVVGWMLQELPPLPPN